MRKILYHLQSWCSAGRACLIGFLVLELWLVWYGRLFLEEVTTLFLFFVLLPLTLLSGLVRVWKKRLPAFRPFAIILAIFTILAYSPQAIARFKFWLYYNDYNRVAALIESGNWHYGIGSKGGFTLPPEYQHLATPTWEGEEKNRHASRNLYGDISILFTVSHGAFTTYQWRFYPYVCNDPTLKSCKDKWELMEGDFHGMFRQ